MPTRNKPITAARALYIKLGAGNCWAQTAFDSNRLLLGFDDIPHQMALSAANTGDFRPIKNFYEKKGTVTPGTATRHSNEIREFYTAGADVLWITFFNGRMWWCFADTEVTATPDANSQTTSSRHRKTTGGRGWTNKDINGQPLLIDALPGSLTSTAGFRGTICRVREFDYLLRRLNSEETKEAKVVRTAHDNLVDGLKPLIRSLGWKDFELLVELVMTQSGFRRVSATGGSKQHKTDIVLELPFTGKRAVVQVKSVLDQATLEKIAPDLIETAGDARVFVVHHNQSDRPLSFDPEVITLIGTEELAKHVINLGLTNWLMEKVA